MFPSDAIWEFFLISQICMGLMGNSILFISYVCTFLTHLKKPVDLIFMHLTLVNVLTIIFKLIPGIMSSFGVKHFESDAGCKAILFTNRVTRGLSICTTTLLSAFQAVIISPSDSNWAWLKSKVSTCIYPSLLFFWILNMLIYSHIIRTVEAKRNSTFVGSGYTTPFCQSVQKEQRYSAVFSSAMVIRDLLFVVLIVWSSIYMVNLLYKHRQRARHLHSPSLSFRTSPEIKATHTILLLVSGFIFFYGLNNFITFYLFYLPKKKPRMENIIGIISSCYPTICPFVLMKNKISRFTSSLSQLKMTFSQRTFSR
ncbi:vomeronasal type-1 receptor 4-like [Camelus bactrianus]|uniref:Vomeronasal type-1 receptor 4-like n=1 Tax=Camelus bactrianus TaxID=9837 RepID=A0AC58QYF9_CAMBA